jgi:FkbM family methyltransferase
MNTRVRQLFRSLPGARSLYRGVSSRVRHHLWRDWYFTHVRRQTRPLVTPLGFVLYAPRFIPNRRMQAGTFEPDEFAYVRKALHECDRLIDVGANIGWYTCLARHAGRPAMAIEPQRANLDCLYRTLAENGWSDTEVVPMGVAESPGLRTLYGASGTGASLIRGWAGYSPRTQQVIPLSTLDALLGGRFAGERLLIKIDVEGAEYDVLRGAVASLTRRPRPAWIVEICLNQYHPSGNARFRDTFEQFWSAGYRAHRIDETAAVVSSDDVARWIASGRTDTTCINYLFLASDVPSVDEGE